MISVFFLGYILPIIFLLIGITLLFHAVKQRVQTLAFLSKAFEATGEVIDLKAVPSQQPGADQWETYAPVISFTSQNGQKIHFTSMASSYPAKYALGDSVRVLYEANRLEQARIRSFHDLWFAPSLLAGLGLVFTALGSGLLIFGVPA